MFYNDFMGDRPVNTGKLLSITLLGAALFVSLFAFRTFGLFDFWWWMATNQIILITMALAFDRDLRSFIRRDYDEQMVRKFWIGVYSAVILYGLFWAGNHLSRRIFEFAGSGIQNVYDFKSGVNITRVFIFILLIIGPGEEIFWRGFLQRNFSIRFGKKWGFLLATLLYAGVHIASGNPMLVLAALVCGLFWGWLFMRFRSVILNVVSHTIWDLAVFIVFPFN